MCPNRIREPLRKGRELVQHRDQGVRPLIDESPEASSLVKQQDGSLQSRRRSEPGR
jgi:hypothetical protein